MSFGPFGSLCSARRPLPPRKQQSDVLFPKKTRTACLTSRRRPIAAHRAMVFKRENDRRTGREERLAQSGNLDWQDKEKREKGRENGRGKPLKAEIREQGTREDRDFRVDTEQHGWTYSSYSRLIPSSAEMLRVRETEVLGVVPGRLPFSPLFEGRSVEIKNSRIHDNVTGAFAANSMNIKYSI